MQRHSIENIAFKTPICSVPFGCKKNKFNPDKKFDIAISMPDEFYNIIDNEFKNILIKFVSTLTDKTGYDEDPEVLEEFYKSPFNKKDGYNAIFNGIIEEDRYNKLFFNDILIDEDSKPVKNPDFLSELEREQRYVLLLTFHILIFIKQNGVQNLRL